MNQSVKNIIGIAAGVITTAAVIMTAEFPAYAGEWKLDSRGWRWMNDDGSYPVNQWAWIDGNHDGIAECYYLEADSYMAANAAIQGMTVDQNGCMTEHGVIQTNKMAGKDFEKAFELVASTSNIQVIDYSKQTETAASPEPEYGPIDANELAYQVAKLVNEERAEAGKEELEINDELMDNAMLRAEEISEFFSHTRPNGDKYYSAITANHNGSGENIVWEKHNTSEAVAASAVDSWLISSGHKNNMLKRNWEETGVGVCICDDGVYIVQEFIEK